MVTNTEIVELNPIKEYKNCCKECGAIDTLWPEFKGRKRFYRCEKCGSIKGGCKPSEYAKVLPCGCVIDTINGATEKFCKQHKEEHDAWVIHNCISTAC